MRVSEAIRALEPRLLALRRDLHAHPELAFEEHRTAALVARHLRGLGLEVHEAIGGTGVVAVLRNGAGPMIGLRADMDALPIGEATNLPHASVHAGRMHACGHDGHTAMLLGAATHLAAHPPGRGTVVFIFQPAEENEGGARVMIEDGLFDRFPVDAVFGLHNWPGLAVGRFAIRPGAMMAAQDTFELRLRGKGSHAAMPHQGIDPITVAGQVQVAWQHIVSRSLSPTEAAVISITQVHAGDSWNAIPDEVVLRGTVRSLVPSVRDRLEGEMRHRAAAIADAYGATVELDYQRRYPPTLNHPAETEAAHGVAVGLVGDDGVATDLPPSMGAEDFAYMLECKPGAYIWLGNGSAEDGRNLHSPQYDFNDQALSLGVAYWVALARHLLPDGM